MKSTLERMPTYKMIIYSMGQLGWSLLVTLASLLTYFYIPPETGDTAIPELVTREAVIGITVIGLCGLVAEWIGLITDPLMAALSDRTKLKFGRRRIYMLIAALPTALLCYLIFQPPVDGVSPINAYWVVGTIVLFNIFRTMFMIPFGALVPELGHSNKQRMMLCTLNSITWALGFVLGGTLIFEFKSILQNSFGMEPIEAFRTVAGAFACLAFMCMLLPSLVVDEKRYCAGHVSTEPPVKALAQAIKNRDFLTVIGAQTIYFMADRFLQLGLVYYITILLKLEESMVATLGVAMFALSFLWYYPVNKAAERISKKKLVTFAFVLQTIIFAMLGLSGLVPVPPMVWAWIIIIVMSLMTALTGIVPGAVTADVVRADGIRTGVYKEATYGAAGSIFMKIPLSLASFAFPAMILLGRSRENPVGVRITTVVSFVLMFGALAVWSRYNEKATLAVLASEEVAEQNLGE